MTEPTLDPWEMFCHMCKQVVENENVLLDVVIFPGGMEMSLVPYDEEDECESD